MVVLGNEQVTERGADGPAKQEDVVVMHKDEDERGLEMESESKVLVVKKLDGAVLAVDNFLVLD